MAKTTEGDRAQVLAKAGYPDSAKAGKLLGQATTHVLERYEGDLNNLREAAAGHGGRLRALLEDIPGMDDAGIAVFLRDVQVFWPEAGPFLEVDQR